eukprot:12431572-Alexandrium_andersonii.AAC.1
MTTDSYIGCSPTGPRSHACVAWGGEPRCRSPSPRRTCPVTCPGPSRRAARATMPAAGCRAQCPGPKELPPAPAGVVGVGGPAGPPPRPRPRTSPSRSPSSPTRMGRGRDRCHWRRNRVARC